MNLYLEKLIFKNEKYFRRYSQIINRALDRPKIKAKIPFYTEKHHIFPKCLCSTIFEKDDPNNHVLLSLREHALAHKILAHGTESIKLKRAYMGMLTARNNTQRKTVLTSREYAFLKLNSRDLYGRKGKENGMYGKSHSEETKDKIRKKALGRKMSVECVNKRKQQNLGKSNPFYGKTHTPQTRQYISEKLLGKTVYIKCYTLKDPLGNKYKLFTKDKMKSFCQERNISYKKIEEFLNKGQIPGAKVVLLMNEKTKNSVGWSAMCETIPVSSLFTVF